MSLLLAAGIVSAAGALTQTGIGAYNLWRGNRDYNRLMRNRPTYDWEMPSEMNLATNVAARGYYAGQDMSEYERSMAGVTSRQIDMFGRYATTSQQMIGAVESAYGQELESLNKLALNNLAQREAARQQYIQSLTLQAQMEREGREKEFQYNQWLPWQMQANRAAERAGLGRQMIYSGISDVFGAGTNLLMGMYKENKLKELLGTNRSVGSAQTEASVDVFNTVLPWNLKRF